jgi:hypothetical protein
LHSAVSAPTSPQLLDEALDLLTGGVFEVLGPAEIDGVGFHQLRIKLVLADDLVEPVADLVTRTVSASVSGSHLETFLDKVFRPTTTVKFAKRSQ